MKKRLTRFLLVMFIVSLIPVTAFAAPRVKTGIITGSVSEQRLNFPSPLSGVTVTVEGTEKTGTTNKYGIYKISNVEIGEVNLNFTKDGYEAGTKAATVVANRLNNVNMSLIKAITAPMVEIKGEVIAKYEVIDVLVTVLRIFPDSLPKILELIIPAETPLRDQVIDLLLKTDIEDIFEILNSPLVKALIGDVDLLDLLLKSFNPQDLINLIPNLPPEIKELLLKIVPSSITNELPLPGTVITVRDEGRVVAVTMADKKGLYELNIPGNYEVEYQLYGFETKKIVASEVASKIILLPAPGTVKGTVTGENDEPLPGTLVTATSAEGKPSATTDANGNYVIKGIKRLLPGFAGGIGAHTILFDKDDYSYAKATALFGFGLSKTNKKLVLAPPFGNLEVLVDTKPAAAWMALGGITVKVFNSEGVMVDTKKITIKTSDIPGLIQQGNTKAKYYLGDLPVGTYKIELSAKVSFFGSTKVLTVSDVEIKAGRTTSLDLIIK